MLPFLGFCLAAAAPSDETTNTHSSPMSPYTVLSYATSHDASRVLRSTCAAGGVPLTLLGLGAQWKGFSQRWIGVLEFLRARGDMPDDHWIFVTDAYDTFCQASDSEIVSVLTPLREEVGDRVLVSAEKYLSPVTVLHLDLAFRRRNPRAAYRYPCAGQYAGTRRSLIAFLQEVYRGDDAADDQDALVRFVASRPERFVLDYERRLFQPNVFPRWKSVWFVASDLHADDLTLVVVDGRVRVVDAFTGRWALFCHLNGAGFQLPAFVKTASLLERSQPAGLAAVLVGARGPSQVVATAVCRTLGCSDVCERGSLEEALVAASSSSVVNFILCGGWVPTRTFLGSHGSILRVLAVEVGENGLLDLGGKGLEERETSRFRTLPDSPPGWGALLVGPRGSGKALDALRRGTNINAVDPPIFRPLFLSTSAASEDSIANNCAIFVAAILLLAVVLKLVMRAILQARRA